MPKQSAGLLVHRGEGRHLEFLLVHPGGPFWKNKDDGGWTIPKGEIAEGEDPLEAAKREFKEELGFAIEGQVQEWTPSKQKRGKIVLAWAVEADCDPTGFKSNTFQLEWPPRSGRMVEFPEIDKAQFFDFEAAKRKINAAQIPFLEQILLGRKAS